MMNEKFIVLFAVEAGRGKTTGLSEAHRPQISKN